MSDARERLLHQAMEYVAEHGMSDLSLRDLAAAIGSSHRMLIYHFESRAGLVAAIVARMERQQQEVLTQLAEECESPTELVERQWVGLIDPALAPFERLFFEVLSHALHGRPGTEGFLDAMTAPWLEVGGEIAEGLGERMTRDELLLGVAVVRGLLLEVLASGDATAPTAALHRFLEMWERSRAKSQGGWRPPESSQ